MGIDWASEYIGLPFKDRGRGPDGWDCWGFFQKLKQEQDGLEIPSYIDKYETIQEKNRVSNAIIRGIEDEWVEVDEDNAKQGDGVVFEIKGMVFHIGYILQPPQFLHIHKNINSCLDRWTHGRWNRRIDGFYRHEDELS